MHTHTLGGNRLSRQDTTLAERLSDSGLGCDRNTIHTTQRVLGVDTSYIHTTQRVLGVDTSYIHTTQRVLGLDTSYID